MIGIDIIFINKFKKIKAIDYNFWSKFYTQKEWQYCFSNAGSYNHLAGIFAAKEAIIKSFGKVKINNHSQIEILHKTITGEPYSKINGLVRKNIQISISHGCEYAIAVAFRN
ncbi:MAG: 4'-phosphopantetheinyl transferase superfamily protein [Nanoarchaeota archaeon]